MIQLLMEIAGWFGYLQRASVVVQLLALLVVIAGAGPMLRRIGAGRPYARHRRAVIATLLSLAALGLMLAGHPYGLVLLGLLLLLGWWALGGLRHLLARAIQPHQLRLLESRLIRPAYLLVAALLVIRLLDNPVDLALIPIGRWFGSEVSLGSLAEALLIVYVLAIGSGPPSQGMAWLLQRSLRISDGSRRGLALLLRYLLVTVGILWGLDHVGFNRTAVLAVAGGLSVGLGFGIKEVFSNFVSGLWLLFEGSVRPGEVLVIEGDPCEVRSLGLRAAVLWRNRDNAELVIPNQTFFTSPTVTYTGSDSLRRSQVLVSAAYRHDPREVIAVLESTAASHPRILQDPAPRGLLLGYGDSAISYALRFWIANPMDNVSICSDVQAAIWRAFQERGLEIPFPQRVLHPLEGPPKT
ncbi:MAG: mechanosensitive ion channel protein MscS [Cyanobium sp. CACIAM 14]|nr:MAG: mechanosensitive ion channel protein MscS [Cyanobium sp. CACIAM 14]